MSLKKNNFNTIDKKFMKFAINLAMNQKGLTGLNPSVGCVIVKNNKIISFGQTDINGRPHAEINALNKNKKNNKGSNLYLTLEPCTHYGKTPPCTNSIIKSKVKNVYYSVQDLDIRTKNKAKKILKLNNIKVKSGLLKETVKKFYKNYYYVKKKNLPYVIGKLACSSNYYILKNSTHITNEHSRNVSHLLRYQNQAILTSYKTINNDNPKLTCRLNGLEKYSPIRIIIDKALKINIKSFIVNNSKKISTFIFYNSFNLKKINYLKKKKIKLVKIKIDSKGNFNLKSIFKKIYELGFNSVLVECGNELTHNILSEKLFNEFYLFKSNKKLKNKLKISVLSINHKLKKTFKNKKIVNTYLDKDKLMHYY
mgnify:CR=1 FL=1|tara:strand:- start:2373 stop:3473 length:1101 start_codon:yes stop_codon:yes gene_type:complete